MADESWSNGTRSRMDGPSPDSAATSCNDDARRRKISEIDHAVARSKVPGSDVVGERGKQIDELARLFEQRRRAVGDTTRVDGLILTYLRQPKAIRRDLKNRIDARLHIAVSSVYGLLRVAEEERLRVSEFAPELLLIMAVELHTTVERLMAELERVVPRDWATQGYASGPKDAALNVVASVEGISSKAVRDRVRDVTAGQAVSAELECLCELCSSGGADAELARDQARALSGAFPDQILSAFSEPL